MADIGGIAFADLQGFIVNNQFILKEICFSIQNSDIKNNLFNPPPSNHYIFFAPFAWHQLGDKCKRSANWLTNNHHGLRWNQGEVDYDKISECIEPLLLQENLLIYVKGDQKVDWLKEVANNLYINCQNIEEIGCNISLNEEIAARSADQIFFKCNKHHNRAINNRCALQNCKTIEYWYQNNYIATEDDKW